MLTEKHSHSKYVITIVFLSIIVAVLLATVAVNTNQLHETESMLSSTQSELNDALIEVGATHAQLTTTETELIQTRMDFAATQNKLTNVQSELQITSDNLTATLEKLAKTEGAFAVTRNQLQTETLQSDSLQNTLDNLQASYDRITTGYGYILKDPTYQAMKSFLAADMTDSKTYDINGYTCEDFSADVIANALKQKIRCAYVIVHYPEGTGHAIVAFNTTDNGLIYVEPQSDDEVNLQLGMRYYQCIIPKPEHYYEKPDYDDTIVKFITVW